MYVNVFYNRVSLYSEILDIDIKLRDNLSEDFKYMNTSALLYQLKSFFVFSYLIHTYLS